MKTNAGAARLNCTYRHGQTLADRQMADVLRRGSVPVRAVRGDLVRWTLARARRRGNSDGATATGQQRRGNSERQQRIAERHDRRRATAHAELLNCFDAKLHGAQSYSARKTALYAKPHRAQHSRYARLQGLGELRWPCGCVLARGSRSREQFPRNFSLRNAATPAPRFENPGVAVLRFFSSAVVLFCDVPFAVAVLRAVAVFCAVQFCVQAVQTVQRTDLHLRRVGAHAHRVVALVDVDRGGGDALRHVAGEKCGRVAHVFRQH